VSAGCDSASPVGSLAACEEAFFEICGVEPTHHELLWHVPFQRVFEGLQSVDGLAKLAGVSRKTIYRRKLQPGGKMALGWLIERRRGTPRPLVTHKDRAHPLNMGNRLLVKGVARFPRTVLDVVDFCRNYFENGIQPVGSLLMRPVEPGKPSNPLHQKLIFGTKRLSDVKAVALAEGLSEPEAGARVASLQKWNGKRKRKIPYDANPRYLNDAKLLELAKKRRLEQTSLYEPSGRVTAKIICNRFSIPRWRFYYWKAGLLQVERKMLDAAMSGKLASMQISAGEDSLARVREGTVPFDDGEVDIDERLGWKEPNV
jgi:hypothetical protein